MVTSREEPRFNISAELLVQLARYAGLPLSAERAVQLAPLMAEPLAALRALRPSGYDDLQPALVYRVPEGA
ncbi:MAG TPA: hypothetical protein VFB73_13165 [Chloroflexota bacterium]|nr:hypothetical protein [Chloroflexota bacterium]